MHTCPPPKPALGAWLAEYPSVEGAYGHLLLQQKPNGQVGVAAALRPYFESAHLDAREHFHKVMHIDLHPDAGAPGAHASYPTALPIVAKSGLFGEALCGLATEAYEFIGGHQWTIPIFLFRFHEDVRAYLFELSRDPERKRAVFGRHGADFIGLGLNPDGSVARLIVGEAKWRGTLTQGVVDRLLKGEKIDDPEGGPDKVHSGKGIWYNVNRELPVPHSVSQLQQLLVDLVPDDFADTILSLDNLLNLGAEHHVPRTDLVVIVGNAKKEAGHPFVDWQNVPAEYEAGNELQVVEVHLENGEDLIDELYGSLWAGGAP